MSVINSSEPARSWQGGNVYYLVANWKSHKQLADVVAWFESLAEVDYDTDRLTVVICPPMPYVFDVYDLIQERSLPFKLGVQDVSSYPLGQYTGAVAADMVADQVDYAIVGHSERRRYFHETTQDVVQKVDMCLQSNVQPIVCVDTPYMEEQLSALDRKAYESMLVAYEPVEAIGSGEADTPKHADTVAREIHDMTSNDVPVLYGGSVDAENIGYFLLQGKIDGALVGTASLKAEEWKTLIEAAIPGA